MQQLTRSLFMVERSPLSFLTKAGEGGLCSCKSIQVGIQMGAHINHTTATHRFCARGGVEIIAKKKKCDWRRF